MAVLDLIYDGPSTVTGGRLLETLTVRSVDEMALHCATVFPESDGRWCACEYVLGHDGPCQPSRTLTDTEEIILQDPPIKAVLG